MDLGSCPKCGIDWMGGESCRSCGYVAVGAGLKGLKRKKRRRRGKYREPGSSTPFLVVTTLALVGYGAYKTKPWQNNWEKPRELLGTAEPHRLSGTWDVVRAIVLDKDAETRLVKQTLHRGQFAFLPKGDVVFQNQFGKNEMIASKGKYEVAEGRIRLSGLGGPDSSIPDPMKFNVAWSGEDLLIASNQTESLWLRRHKEDSPTAAMTKQMMTGRFLDATKDIRGQFLQEMNQP